MARAARALYGAGMEAFVAGARLALRNDPTLPERLGEARPDVTHPWLVHAVSVGEVRAAGAFVEALAAARPDARVLLTTGNRDGRAAAERLRARVPAVATVAYLPWDRPRVVARWLAALAPEAVVIVETEIWPSLFFASRELGLPLFLVSGRMPAREARGYGLARSFFREVLACTDGIAAQTEDDRERFLSIGAPAERLWVGGNLKLDAACDPPCEGLAGTLLVAGSTHPPEERWLLGAFTRLREAHRGLRLVLAPRHPERAAEVAEEARAAGFAAELFSRRDSGSWDVLVVDVLGVLPSLYAAAAAAFVGGSLVPRGGQSPIEPAAAGVPIAMGPYDGSFREVSTRLEGAGALVRIAAGVEAVGGLTRVIGALLANETERVERGACGRAVVEAGRGAARETVARLLSRMRGS